MMAAKANGESLSNLGKGFLSLSLVLRAPLAEIGIDLSPVPDVVGNRSVDLLKTQGRERFRDALRRLPVEELVDNRIEG
jgi:hypothetical protein